MIDKPTMQKIKYPKTVGYVIRCLPVQKIMCFIIKKYETEQRLNFDPRFKAHSPLCSVKIFDPC